MLSKAFAKRDLAELPKLSDEERIFRRLLFFMHSSCDHRNLYGDDGEMHCHTCDIDFVRDSAKDIEERISDINLAKYAESLKGNDTDE